MPELPEVEAARRAIEEHCIGKKIIKAIIAVDSIVIDAAISPEDFEASLIGKTIVSTHRKGKNMWFQLDSPPFPSFQFGMAGAIYIKGVAVTMYKRAAVSDTDEWPSKYSKFFVELDDGLELSFTDKRRFAKVRLLDNPAAVPPISELGPDALLEPLTIDELIRALSKKKIGIKALILDQSFVSGIGNWIADEVLYQARIHPLQAASSLSKENCAALHKSIKEVIEKAVEVGADTSQFPSDWIFHSRGKKPGKAFVDGKKIDFIAAGGRTTAYVPQLQILSGPQASKTQIKPRKQAAKKGSKDEESAEEPDSSESEDEDEKPQKIKPKGRKTTTSSSRKAPPIKKKKGKNDSDDDSGDSDSAYSEGDDKRTSQKRKPKSVRKAPPTKKKKGKNDDDDSNEDEDSSDEGSDYDEKEVVKKKTKTAKRAPSVNGVSKRATSRK